MTLQIPTLDRTALLTAQKAMIRDFVTSPENKSKLISPGKTFVDSEKITAGNTHSTWRVFIADPDHKSGQSSFIIQISPPISDVPSLKRDLERKTLLSNKLANKGIPSSRTVTDKSSTRGRVGVLTHSVEGNLAEELVGTAWVDYAPVNNDWPIDYQAWGKAIRTLHAQDSSEFEASDGHLFPWLHRFLTLDQEITSQWSSSALTKEEAKLLLHWFPTCVDTALELKDKIGDSTLIHGDLRPSNVIQVLNPQSSKQGKDGSCPIRLVDWENAGWGVTEMDLHFLVNAFHTGSVSKEDYSAFKQGYQGFANFPSKEQAHKIALLYRMDSIIKDVQRRAWDPAAEQRLAKNFYYLSKGEVKAAALAAN